MSLKLSTPPRAPVSLGKEDVEFKSIVVTYFHFGLEHLYIFWRTSWCLKQVEG